MKRLGFVIKTDCPEADRFFAQIFPKLKEKYEIFVDSSSAKRLKLRSHSVDLSKMEVDLLLTLGGDGTLLYTLNQIPHPTTPILGVNFGERGFLMEIEPDNFARDWEKIENGNYKIQTVPRIAAKVNQQAIPDAINEHYLYSASPDKMLDVSISINQNALFSGKMDGVIIASTLGSTGHAMSAGGPLIHPTLDCFEIIPIFPLKFSFRPFLVNADVTIEIKLQRVDREGVMVGDGIQISKVPPMSQITLFRSETKAQFIRVRDTYYDRIRMKILQRG